MNVWSGLVSPAGAENEKPVVPKRVAYVDSIFTVDYPEKVSRLFTPVTVQECGGNGSSIMIDQAIWDTGAVTSCIAEEIAERENMHPVDTGMVVTLAGHQEVAYYIVNVRLSDTIVMHNVKVAAIPMAGRAGDFVIGMDIISQGNFSVKNENGKTTASFRLL